jgi:hypothetical protein
MSPKQLQALTRTLAAVAAVLVALRELITVLVKLL